VRAYTIHATSSNICSVLRRLVRQSLTRLQDFENLVIRGMDGRCQMHVGSLGIAVASDDRASISEQRVGIRIDHRVLLSCKCQHRSKEETKQGSCTRRKPRWLWALFSRTTSHCARREGMD